MVSMKIRYEMVVVPWYEFGAISKFTCIVGAYVTNKLAMSGGCESRLRRLSQWSDHETFN
jgi:hypothetical protein